MVYVFFERFIFKVENPHTTHTTWYGVHRDGPVPRNGAEAGRWHEQSRQKDRIRQIESLGAAKPRRK